MLSLQCFSKSIFKRVSKRVCKRLESRFPQGFSKTLSSAHTADGQVVAEDHEMRAVLHCLKAAPFDFAQERLAPREPFDIANPSLHDTALFRSRRGEYLRDPLVRSQVDW
jgi:hypothetical protein